MTRAARVALVLLLGPATGGCETTFIDPMERQPKDKPFRASALFGDGRAMRPLLPGTVAREQLIGPPALLDGRDAAGAWLTTIPLAVTREVLRAGQQRFAITCAACHGPLGDGQSPVARRMMLRAPPSLIAPPVASYPPGRVFHAAANGYGLMPAYGAEVPRPELWAAVAYLEALRLSQGAPLEAAPPAVQQLLRSEHP